MVDSRSSTSCFKVKRISWKGGWSGWQRNSVNSWGHIATLTGLQFDPLPSMKWMRFPGGSDSKESAYNSGDLSLIPGSERSPGEGNGYLLQCSCLENSVDRGVWQSTVHWVTESRTRLSTHGNISSAMCSTTPEWWLINMNILFRNLRKGYCLREGKIKLENSNKLFSYTKSSCHFIV